MSADARTPSDTDDEREKAPASETAQTDEKPDPLSPALRALDRGDLVEARRLARALIDSADVSDEVHQRAHALELRLRRDPVTIAVMLATGVLMLYLAAMYLHAH